jgi:magnesium transporter
MAKEFYGLDWIAHGIIDSVVDAFFPVLGVIEREVENVDSFVLESSTNDDAVLEPSLSDLDTIKSKEILVDDEKGQSDPEAPEQKQTSSLDSLRLKFQLPPSAPAFSVLRRLQPLFLRRGRLRSYFRRDQNVKSSSSSSATRTLIRMAAMRRIVTSLGRLLGTKGEVVAQMRKRHLIALNGPTSDSNAGEFAVHMGDIHGAYFSH